MTSGGTGDDRLNKNQRRDAAREKARQRREAQKKKERRNRVLLQSSLILVALGIVTVVAFILVNAAADAQRSPSLNPLNMASDGIVIGEDFAAADTPRIEPGGEPVVPRRADDDPIAITVYLDYQCPVCQQFEQTNAEQIATLVERGVATIEYRPVAILDRSSAGTRYSTRSANAAACVANYSPDSYYEFNGLLLSRQPPPQTEGLTDAELIGLTEDADISDASDIAQCVEDEEFANWVAAATSRASDTTELLDEDGEFGTPRVLVNDELYTGSMVDVTEFTQFIAAADSEAFAGGNASPSPSPSASPSPSPTP